MFKKILESYNLSFIQHGILSHTLRSNNPSMYKEQFSCILSGNISVEILNRAWKLVFKKYSILRTSFTWLNVDKPIQNIHEYVNFIPEYKDLSTLSYQEKINVFKIQSLKELSVPFDLANSPLMLVKHYKLSDDLFGLIWTYHHILIDGWSRSIILSDLVYFYNQLKMGSNITLDSTPNYSQFVNWQNKYNSKSSLSFWHNELKGFARPTPLPLENNISLKIKNLHTNFNCNDNIN